MPAGRERSRLGLAVADDARDEQVGVVECRAERVRKRIAELAAFVDRAGRLGCDVTRDPSGERELSKEPAQAFLVPADLRVDLAVRSFEVRARDESRPAVAGACDEDRAEVARADRTVEVCVEQGETGSGAEVAEQARLDVLAAKRLAEEWIVEQIDLPDGEVVRGAPPSVEEVQLVCGERGVRCARLDGHGPLTLLANEPIRDR